jgi:hypothetical protein
MTNRECKRDRIEALALDLFNAIVQVGDEVLYRPFVNSNDHRLVRTRSEAWLNNERRCVVHLEGFASPVDVGCCLMSDDQINAARQRAEEEDDE